MSVSFPIPQGILDAIESAPTLYSTPGEPVVPGNPVIPGNPVFPEIAPGAAIIDHLFSSSTVDGLTVSAPPTDLFGVLG